MGGHGAVNREPGRDLQSWGDSREHGGWVPPGGGCVWAVRVEMRVQTLVRHQMRNALGEMCAHNAHKPWCLRADGAAHSKTGPEELYAKA